jgi:hypothetical protein
MTANAGTSGTSGLLVFKSGTTSVGGSGSVSIETGAATGGTGGALSLSVGAGDSGAGGAMTLTAGLSSASSGGSMSLSGGQGSNAGGAVSINGGASSAAGAGGNVNIIPGTSSTGSKGEVLIKDADSTTRVTVDETQVSVSAVALDLQATSTGNIYATGGLTIDGGNTGITVSGSVATTVGSGLVASGLEGTPSAATDTCTKGTIKWDSSYMYICVATNTYKRALLASWA